MRSYRTAFHLFKTNIDRGGDSQLMTFTAPSIASTAPYFLVPNAPAPISLAEFAMKSKVLNLTFPRPVNLRCRIVRSAIIFAGEARWSRRGFHLSRSEIDPLEGERSRVGRAEAENLQLVERGASFFVEPLFGLGGFLDRSVPRTAFTKESVRNAGRFARLFQRLSASGCRC